MPLHLPQPHQVQGLLALFYSSFFQVNLRAVALGTKHASRAMIAAGTRGCILNTSSVAGFRVNIANSHAHPGG